MLPRDPARNANCSSAPQQMDVVGAVTAIGRVRLVPIRGVVGRADGAHVRGGVARGTGGRRHSASQEQPRPPGLHVPVPLPRARGRVILDVLLLFPVSGRVEACRAVSENQARLSRRLAPVLACF